VSTFSVRDALGRVPSARQGARGGAAAREPLPVLPDPVPRDAGPVRLLGEGAVPVFTPGARYPLTGLLLVLPALEGTGLLDAARPVYGQLKDGFYGLAATLLTLVFLALAGEPRAEGAARSRRPRWAGCSGWTGRRRSRRSAASWASSPPRARPPSW
jgi:hypothetical protein